MLRFRARYDLPLRATALLFFGLALAGCGPGGAWAMAFVALFWLGSLSLSGCSTSHTTTPDGAVPEADASADGGGAWERCCVDGRLSTCFCPAMTSCNYGRGMIACDDGTCGYGPSSGGGGFICDDVDAGRTVPDAGGGEWEPCCQDGVITTCLCPGGAECNYGWFTECSDGSCVYGGPDTCEPEAVDAGVERDAGEPGTWEACCVDGRIDVCFCPAGAICNYGIYEDCGEGYCAFPPGSGCPG